ncbi:MAG: GGDEF domain-containing protein, partial [Treponemataceae bacterium]
MNPLSEFWRVLIDSLVFAFQPVVNIHTGAVYGFEALLRGVEAGGFPSIHALFDAAFADGVLYSLDFRLREKALSLFRDITDRGSAKLFYNLDNRITEMPDYSPGNTFRLLEKYGLEPSVIVFEVSERHEFSDYAAARGVLSQYKNQNFRIAVDDFGAGYSGLQLLYFAHPDLIKIDRFFVDGIDADQRKRMFAERIVDMAHLMGIQVVAEGVETEKEFNACRKIGCDLVQGYLIERPQIDQTKLKSHYPLVAEMTHSDRRGISSSAATLRSRIDPVVPALITDDILSVLERFRGISAVEETPAAIPVLDSIGSCVGLLRERDFRKYVYSPFGIAVLRHAASSTPFGGLMVSVPTVDVNAKLRTIQSLFIGTRGVEGVVVTENGKYAGFLDARSILEAVAEQEVTDARDQNPLSRLPGNAKLDEYLLEHWDDPSSNCLFCYFDFNDFKPFNDHYGFRRGDRVIQLFAGILRDVASRSGGWFVAHIGGDDFFAGIDCPSLEAEIAAETGITEVLTRFSGSVVAFYDEVDRLRGGIEERDRNGVVRI